MRSREAFDSWYDTTSEWEDGLDHNWPGNATPALQAWFKDMTQVFSQMNGPHAPDLADTARWEKVADHCIAKDMIHVGFAWSHAEEANELSKALAEKHGLAFLDASGDEGATWFPNSQSNAGPPQVSLTPAGGGLGAARPWEHSEGKLEVVHVHGGE